MSIKEIYEEAKTHAVMKKSDLPICTRDIRPSMYELLKLPDSITTEHANYIDNDMKELVMFIAGRENGKTALVQSIEGTENGKRS